MGIGRLDLKTILRVAALVIAVILWLIVREAMHGFDDADPFDLWGPHQRGS